MAELKTKGKLFMKKLLSLMLALVMLVSLVPTVFATDSSVTVDFSASDGATIIMKEKIAVTDGLAEKYGFEYVDLFTLVDA